MGLSKKQRAELARRKKQHDKRPKPRDLAPVGRSARKRMARDHVDVLQNIEFALAQAYREDPAFDDAAALAALQAAGLGETQVDDPHADLALQLLHGVRARREDVSDKTWSDGLRVVMDSVRRHSGLHDGETSYLEFIDEYAP